MQYGKAKRLKPVVTASDRGVWGIMGNENGVSDPPPEAASQREKLEHGSTSRRGQQPDYIGDHAKQ